MSLYPLVRPALFALDPETAHTLALRALACAPTLYTPPPSLRTQVLGLDFPSPIGMAAGFDKNAEALRGLRRIGFGFVEAGTVTKLPQDGNPRPRLFRLREDQAIINRLGFNGKGAEYFLARARRPRRGILGINIGKNRDSQDAIADYTDLLRLLAPHADYIAVNVSSPNTQNLRALQEREALDALLAALLAERDALARRVPLLLKIAPDLERAQAEAIAEVALARRLDGLIVSNTTLARPHSLQSALRGENGGLSGKPLFGPSTALLHRMHKLTGGQLALIGVGGVANAEDAYAKIRAGASLVQLYTALVYQGPGLVRRLHEGLEMLLARDGFKTVAEAVGADHAA